MKIMVVGSGGREHAIAWALSQGNARRENLKLYCAPGNAGIAQIAECVPLQATDVIGLARFAADERIDLTVVGGEAALAAGLVDEFQARRLRIAGPRSAAARLEASKVFAKNFMMRHQVPTARWRAARGVREALEILAGGELGGENDPVVIKMDGLAAGKGVVVAGDRREAAAAVESLSANAPAQQLVVEEALVGREASLLLFSDGKDYSLMPAARDHKRIGENDTGPNTGGMGAVTDPGIIDAETLRRVVREIVEPTLIGTRADGILFRGVLFIGLMLTADGPRVLEYNVRFGDPEAQSILVRLRSDFVEVCEAMADVRLGATSVSWSDEASACVVLAAPGYPAHSQSGGRIEGLENLDAAGVEIFHGGTARGPNGEWLTAGGRVLGVTATGPALDDALRSCYAAADKISWDGMQYRRDIGRFH